MAAVYRGSSYPLVVGLLQSAAAATGHPHAAARDRPSVGALGRRFGPAGRELRRRGRRALRHHRSERRRQDEPAQLHQRRLPSTAGVRSIRRGGRDADEALGAHAPGYRPHLPEHRAVQGHDGARQPAHRPPLPPEDGRAGRRALLRAGRAGGDPGPRAHRGDHRLPGDPAGAQAGGAHARLRPAEARGAGARAGARAAPALARRADGRHERRGEGGHGALHPRRERGARHDHPHDRARHGRGDGALAPRGGAQLRAEDRGRHARGGAAQPRGPARVPGRGGRRVTGSAGEADTFPKLLARNAGQLPAKAALREKDLGIWRETSWRDYHERVRDFSLGLVDLGLARGGKVAVIGDNRPEWVIAELAAQAAGAASVGIYQDSNLTEVAYVIDHCDAHFVVAEDQEQVDKILGMIDQLPKVSRVVYSDPRGLRRYRHEKLISFEEVEKRGRALGREKPGLFAESVARGKGSDLAMICYTSGTTGQPKGAMLSFEDLLAMALSLHQVDPRKADDEFVSFLPLAWIGEQMMSVATALAIAFTVNFPEEPETALHDIREIGPHVLFAPPRIWEGLNSTVQVKIMDTTPIKRVLYERLMPVGYKVADLRPERGRVPLP